MSPHDPADDRPEAPPQPPMLILGEDRDDVEDTTPEQLERQQREARREIERAQREARRELEHERAAVERALEAKKAASERQHKQAQARLDQAQRDLYRKERRLRKELSQRGLASASQPLVELPDPVKSSGPSAPRSLVRSVWAWTLTGATIISLVTAGLLGGQVGHDAEAIDAFVAADEARMAWLQVGLQLDEDLSAHLAGQEVEQMDGVPATLALVRAATAAYPLEHDFYARGFEDKVPAILSEGVNPVSALTVWSRLQSDSNYAVSRSSVADLRDIATSSSPVAPISGTVAIGSLLLLIVLAWRARAWVSLPLLLAATALAIAMVAQLATPGSIVEARETHDDAVDTVRDVKSVVDDDLAFAYGLSSRSLDQEPEYWTATYYLDDFPPTSERAAYAQARAELGAAVDSPQVYAAGLGAVDAGRAAVQVRAEDLESARTHLVDSLQEETTSPTTLVLGGLSALLAAAAFALSWWRARDEQEDPA